MSLLLHIDCAVDSASVVLSAEGRLLGEKHCPQQKDQAAFLQPAIADLLKEQKLPFKDLTAVSVVAGPGSYTGLRVAMASAKGLCFALDLPLVCIGTLEMLAAAARLSPTYSERDSPLICPMIDARRMEVFTALYDSELTELVAPHALILDQGDAAKSLLNKHVLFAGNGAAKLRHLTPQEIPFAEVTAFKSLAMIELSQARFLSQRFTPLSAAAPLYVKPFFTP